MIFNGSYLRVTTPKTTNGIIPATVDGKVLEKETFLPLSARKQIERKNNRLKRNGFPHLVSKIEVVNGAEKKANDEKLKADLAELEQLRKEKAESQAKIDAPKKSKEKETVKEPS